MASIDLTKLQPGKTYNVAVRAKDDDGNYSGYSVNYKFTTPSANLNGSQLVGLNSTVVTALAQGSGSVVGGALTAGGLDSNGVSYAGKAQLADVWNGAASAISSMTGTASTGAVIINSTGILGYKFATSSSGQAQFFLNTADGNAYFRGTIFAGAGQIGGFTIGADTLTATGFVLNTTGRYLSLFDTVTPTTKIVNLDAYNGIWAGNSTLANAPFRVDLQGNLIATSASISGSISATSGSIGGFSIEANALTATNISLNSTSGFALGSASQFRVTQTGSLTATNASITGNIVATSGSFTGNITASTGSVGGFNIGANALTATNISLDSVNGFALGSASQFRVTQTGALTATSASITGNINATSGSFSGNITAQSGTFTGAVQVQSGGSLYAGANVGSGQRVLLDSTGLFGYDGNGIQMFSIPTATGASPTIARFQVLTTGIASEGSGSTNFIIGNSGSAASATANNITLNGQLGQMYSVINGIQTASSTGSGFYVDKAGNFRLAGASGVISMSNGNLSVTGNINATSGSFTGALTSSSGIIGGWTIGSTALTSTNVGLNSANSPQVPGSTTSSNLLTNPGFETGTLSGWSGVWNATTLNPRSGSYSANYGPSNPPALTQTVAVVPSFVYNLSIWARMGTSTVPSSSLSIIWIDSSSNTISTNTTTFTITSTYSQFSLSGIVAPTNAASAIISITPGAFSSNGVYVDDTSFTTTNSLGAVSIYSGSSFANATQAPFIVTNTGNLIASNASITGNVTAQSGSIGGFTITSTSLYAGSTGSFVGIVPASVPFFAGALGNTGAGAKFSVSNAGAMTSTLGNIGSWTIGSDNIRSNTFGRNIILSSASNSISFTNTSGSIIASMISGSSRSGSAGSTEGLIIQISSNPSYTTSKYPYVGLSQSLNPLGTDGYISLMGSASTYVSVEPSSLDLYSGGGTFIYANNQLDLKSNAGLPSYAEILMSNLGNISMYTGGTSALTISTTQNVSIPNGSISAKTASAPVGTNGFARLAASAALNTFYFTATTANPSSKTTKDVIKEDVDALVSDLSKIKTIKYTYKNDPEKIIRFGMYAEDALQTETFKDYVYGDPKNPETLAMNTQEMFSVILEYIKDIYRRLGEDVQ
jgi:hypothetical protein